MIPETTIQITRDVIGIQARALAECAMLVSASEHASGVEAEGIAALAREMEQVGKVLGNYMPRLLKHIGEIETPVPDAIADLIRENEPHGEARARLWQLYVDLQSRIADNGKSMESPTSEQYATHTRLHGALGWLERRAVETLK